MAAPHDGTLIMTSHPTTIPQRGARPYDPHNNRPYYAGRLIEELPDEEPGGTLQDLVAGLKRRRRAFLITAAGVAALSLAVAMLIPATYRSSATVLIQDQEVPPEFVRTTVSSIVEERLQVISQQVMTRPVLLGIIEEFDLYPKERARLTVDETVERFRKNIKLTTINADVRDRRDDRRRSGAVAFQLSYESQSPQAAQRVVNKLVSLYLNENLRSRQQRATETAAFLGEEADRLAARISEIENRLADFKSKNAGQLPQLMQLNLSTIDRTDAEIHRIDRDLSVLEDRRAALQTQLASVRDLTPQLPMPQDKTLLEPVERLRLMQNQLVSLAGRYSEDHPDVRRMRREIEALRLETGAETPSTVSNAAIEDARRRLDALRERFTAAHPDVERQERVVAALEAGKGTPRAGSRETMQGRAETQLMITLRGQLSGVEGEVRALRQSRQELVAKKRLIEARVEQTPAVEKAYLDLTRDLDNALERYREITAKQMQAGVAESLEKNRKGERFVLIDPPQLPEAPTSPNRPALLALGMVLSLGSGFGVGIAREALDRTVRDRRELVRITGLRLLGTLPYVLTPAETARQSRRRKWAIGGIVAALALATLLIHLFVTPLPVLWFALARQLGIGQ